MIHFWVHKGQRVAFTHFNCWFLCRADMKKEACMTIFMTTSTLYSLILKYAAFFIMMLHTCRWNNPGILKPNVTKHHANPSCIIQKIGISTCYRFTALNSPKQDCSHSLSFYFPSSSLYAFSMLFTTLFLQLNIISQRKGQLIFEMWERSCVEGSRPSLFLSLNPQPRPSGVWRGHRETKSSYRSFNAFDPALWPMLCLNLLLWSEASFLLPPQ